MSHAIDILKSALSTLPLYLQTGWQRCIKKFGLETEEGIVSFIFGTIVEKQSNFVDSQSILQSLREKMQSEAKNLRHAKLRDWLHSLNVRYFDSQCSSEDIDSLTQKVLVDGSTHDTRPFSSLDLARKSEWLLKSNRIHPLYFKHAFIYRQEARALLHNVQSRFLKQAAEQQTTRVRSVARSNWKADRAVGKRKRSPEADPTISRAPMSTAEDLCEPDTADMHNNPVKQTKLDEALTQEALIAIVRGTCIMMTFRQGLSVEKTILQRRAKVSTERLKNYTALWSTAKNKDDLQSLKDLHQDDLQALNAYNSLEDTLREYNCDRVVLQLQRANIPAIQKWLLQWSALLIRTQSFHDEVEEMYHDKREQLEDNCFQSRNALVALEVLQIEPMSLHELTQDWREEIAEMDRELVIWKDSWTQKMEHSKSLLTDMWELFRFLLTGCVCSVNTTHTGLRSCGEYNRSSMLQEIDRLWAEKIMPLISDARSMDCACSELNESNLRTILTERVAAVQRKLLRIESTDGLSGDVFTSETKERHLQLATRESNLLKRLKEILDKADNFSAAQTSGDDSSTREYILFRRKMGGLICSLCGCGQQNIQLNSSQDYITYSMPRGIHLVQSGQYPIRLRSHYYDSFHKIREEWMLPGWLPTLYIQQGTLLRKSECKPYDWTMSSFEDNVYQQIWLQGYNRVLFVILQLLAHIDSALRDMSRDFGHTVCMSDALECYTHFPICRTLSRDTRMVASLLQGLFVDSKKLTMLELGTAPGSMQCSVSSAEISTLLRSLNRVPLCHLFKGGALNPRNTLQKQCLGNDTNNLARLVLTPSRQSAMNVCRLMSDAASDLRVLTIVTASNHTMWRQRLLNFGLMHARHSVQSKLCLMDHVHGRARPVPSTTQLLPGAILYVDVFPGPADNMVSQRFRFSQQSTDYVWQGTHIGRGWTVLATVLQALSPGSIVCHPVTNRQAIVFSRSPVLRGSSIPAMQVEVSSLNEVSDCAPLLLSGKRKPVTAMLASANNFTTTCVFSAARDYPHSNQICPSACFFSNADFDGDQSTVNAGIHPAQRLGALVGAPVVDNTSSTQSGRSLMGLSVVHAATFAVLARQPVGSAESAQDIHAGERLSYTVVLDMASQLERFAGWTLGQISRHLDHEHSRTNWRFAHVLALLFPRGFWFHSSSECGYSNGSFRGSVGASFVLPNKSTSIWAHLRLLYPLNVQQVLSDMLCIINVAHAYCSYPTSLADTCLLPLSSSTPHGVVYSGGRWVRATSGTPPTPRSDLQWEQYRHWRLSIDAPSAAEDPSVWLDWCHNHEVMQQKLDRALRLSDASIRLACGSEAPSSLSTGRLAIRTRNDADCEKRAAYEAFMLRRLMDVEATSTKGVAHYLQAMAPSCERRVLPVKHRAFRHDLYTMTPNGGFGLQFAITSGVKGSVGKLKQLLVERGGCLASWSESGTLPRTVGRRGSFNQRLLCTESLRLHDTAFPKRTLAEIGVSRDAFVRGLSVESQTLDAIAGVVPQRTSTSEVYKSGTTTKQLLHICSEVYLGAGMIGSLFTPRSVVTYAMPDFNGENACEDFSCPFQLIVWGTEEQKLPRVPLQNLPALHCLRLPASWAFTPRDVARLSDEKEESLPLYTRQFIEQVHQWLHPNEGAATVLSSPRIRKFDAFVVHMVVHELYLFCQCPAVDGRGLEYAFDVTFVVENVFLQLNDLEGRGRLHALFGSRHSLTLLQQAHDQLDRSVLSFYKCLQNAIWQMELLSSRHLYRQTNLSLPLPPEQTEGLLGRYSPSEEPFRYNFYARNWHTVLMICTIMNPARAHATRSLEDYQMALAVIVDTYQRSMEEYGCAIGYQCATNLQEAATQAQLNTRHGSALTDTEQINTMVWNKPRPGQDVVIVEAFSDDSFQSMLRRFPSSRTRRECIPDAFELSIPLDGLFQTPGDTTVRLFHFTGPTMLDTSACLALSTLVSSIASVVVIDTQACRTSDIDVTNLVQSMIQDHEAVHYTTVWENNQEGWMWVVTQNTYKYKLSDSWPEGYQLSGDAFQWFRCSVSRQSTSLTQADCLPWLNEVLKLYPGYLLPTKVLSPSDHVFMERARKLWHKSYKQECSFAAQVSRDSVQGEIDLCSSEHAHLPPPLPFVTLTDATVITESERSDVVPTEYTDRLDDMRDTPYTVFELRTQYPWLFNLLYMTTHDGDLCLSKEGVDEWMECIRRTTKEEIPHQKSEDTDGATSGPWVLRELNELLDDDPSLALDAFVPLLEKFKDHGTLNGNVAMKVGHHFLSLLRTRHVTATGFLLSRMGHLPSSIGKIGAQWMSFLLQHFEHNSFALAVREGRCEAIKLGLLKIRPVADLQLNWESQLNNARAAQRLVSFMGLWDKHQAVPERSNDSHVRRTRTESSSPWPYGYFESIALHMSKRAFSSIQLTLKREAEYGPFAFSITFGQYAPISDWLTVMLLPEVMSAGRLICQKQIFAQRMWGVERGTQNWHTVALSLRRRLNGLLRAPFEYLDAKSMVSGTRTMATAKCKAGLDVVVTGGMAAIDQLANTNDNLPVDNAMNRFIMGTAAKEAYEYTDRTPLSSQEAKLTPIPVSRRVVAKKVGRMTSRRQLEPYGYSVHSAFVDLLKPRSVLTSHGQEMVTVDYKSIGLSYR
jgi:hypothetical protein